MLAIIMTLSLCSSMAFADEIDISSKNEETSIENTTDSNSDPAIQEESKSEETTSEEIKSEENKSENNPPDGGISERDKSEGGKLERDKSEEGISEEGTSEEDEKMADKWSMNMLIKAEDFETFKKKKDYSERSVVRFAEDQGIAPGIVVGRMQNEHMINHNMLNSLKEKYEIAV